MAGTGDILVGVDKSPESRWAVHSATREARLRSATLTLVHVRSTNRRTSCRRRHRERC